MDEDINIREYSENEWPKANITAVEKDREELARYIFEQLPYIRMPTGNFLVWNPTKKYYQEFDKDSFMGLITNKKIIGNNNQLFDNQTRVLNALRSVNNGRVREAYYGWMHIGEQYVNVLHMNDDGTFSRREEDAHPRWYVPNRIPWNLGTSAETPIMDKLFREWVGEESYELLYDIIAYCLLRDNPLDLVFAFVGGGANGKSTFLEVVRKFLGRENIASNSLLSLSVDKFSKATFYKKLAVFISETPTLQVTDWMNLKMLCGDDDIEFEFKHQQKFTGKNYAKILICSNGLPVSIDNSDGFFRRWMVIDFPRQFTERVDVLRMIPDVEFQNLALKCTLIIPRLVVEGKLRSELPIGEKRRRYLLASNPFPLFKKDMCVLDVSYSEPLSDVYDAYKKWLLSHNKRVVEFRVLKDYLLNTDSEVDLRRDVGAGYLVFGLRLKSRDELLRAEQAADNMPVQVVDDVLDAASLRDSVLMFVKQKMSEGSDLVDVGDILSVFPGCESLLERLRVEGELVSYRPGFLRTM